MALRTCTDHNNVAYPSVKTMCTAYGITEHTYRWRMKNGYTQESALTEPVRQRRCKITCFDGKRYPSKKAMCEAYGISPRIYKDRVKNGWSMKSALTTPKNGANPEKRNRKIACFDGKLYDNVKDMCMKYNIDVGTYRSRIQAGVGQEQALTTAANGLPKNKIACFDGKEYANTEEMCKAYGMPISTYRFRIKQGYTQKRALTEPNRKRRSVECFDGKTYNTVKEMLEAHGVDTATYYNRLKQGCTQEEALTMPSGTYKVECFDGKIYKNTAEMCEAYGISYTGYKDRIHAGWSQKDALTKPLRKTGEAKYADYAGREFTSYADMASFYRVCAQSISDAMDGNTTLTLETLSAVYARKIRNGRIQAIGGIILRSHISGPFFLANIQDGEIIMHIENILAMIEKETQQSQSQPKSIRRK